MKLILKLLVIILIIAIIGGVVAINNVEKIVSKVGTETLGVPVSVGNIGVVGLFSGNLSVSDLNVGNPAGFKAAQSLGLQNIDVSIDLASAQTDVVNIKHIKITQPMITLETTAKGNNLKALVDNAKANTASSGSSNESNDTASQSSGSTKNVTIDLVELTGGKVNVITPLSEKPIAVDLPSIKIENIGKDGNNGIPAEEAIEIIIKAISSASSRIDLDQLKGQLDGLKGMGKDIEDQLKSGDVEGIKGAADKLKKLF